MLGEVYECGNLCFLLNILKTCLIAAFYDENTVSLNEQLSLSRGLTLCLGPFISRKKTCGLCKSDGVVGGHSRESIILPSIITPQQKLL